MGVIEALLRKLDRFAPLSPDEKRALEAAVSGVDTYTRHDIIVRQGDRPTHSCIMVEGMAARYKGLANGNRQIVSFQIPGDFSDLHSMFLKALDHGIEALSPVRIARVPHQSVDALMREHPGLARAFSWDMAVDGAITREWLASTGRRSAYERVAHLLCELMMRLRSVGLANGDAYELPITQADLSDAFGISTVHVNRMLQTLRRNGLIELKGAALRIPNVAALEEVAGFEAAYLE
ncbi:MAG TPA: Crp/Fnr family transcriptional regulator [Beijerinckiaceae bacterium]|nr:Crp/Fnr family transcriptional regulator [Beijerinckiaceae bacterium]